MDIHLICKEGEKFGENPSGEFRTGEWHISKTKADESIGGMIYLHEAKNSPAWVGGRILRYYTNRTRNHPDEGRQTFIFEKMPIGIVYCSGNWGQEKCFVEAVKPEGV